MTRSPLRKPTSFAWLWASTTSGALAEGISLSVLPLLMTTLTRDPVVVSTLQAAAALPWLMFGLQAGALADRWDRGRVLLLSDLARTTIAALLALLVLLDLVSVLVLLGFAFFSSVATVMYRSADGALLPSLVSSEQLPQANGRLQTGTTIMGNFIGPTLGSTLFTLAHALPVLAQAIAFASSFVFLRGLPKRFERPERSGLSLRHEIAEGVGYLRRDRPLLTLAGASTLEGIATWMLMAVLVLYSLEVLDASSAAYGLLFTVYSVGSLTAAALTGHIADTLSTRTSMTAAALLSAASLFIMATTTTFITAAAAMALLGFAGMVLNIVAVSERQRRTPEHLLGRISGVFNVLNVGSAPIAAPIAGLIARHWGLPTAIAICGATFACAAALIHTGLKPRRRDGTSGHGQDTRTADRRTQPTARLDD